MNFFKWLKNCLLRLFTPSLNEQEEVPYEDIEQDYNSLLVEAEIRKEEIEKFKMKNIVFEKLNYLEQYIKIFSLSFPNEYNSYLNHIRQQRSEYETELSNYRQGFSGNITFAVDPEEEAKRISHITELEKQIKEFVDFTVFYSMYKEKFATLCHKLNKFYNALINYRIESEQVARQFKNATASAQNLINEVKDLTFFEHDSRKKEEILNHIIYCDYILFKIALRYSICTSLEEYRHSFSRFYNLFITTEYDSLIFKFFIQDLEEIQAFIIATLQQYESYDYILDSCQKLQIEMRDFSGVISQVSYFEEILKLENTLEEVSKTFGVDFIVNVPKWFATSDNETTSVNNIAISVLKLINNGKAKILLELVKSFKIDISWKEFYFLCKIFHLYQDVVAVSKNTIFSSVETNFLNLSEKYPEYSDEYIAKQKSRLLNYNGSTKKKYILLFIKGTININFAIHELKGLNLDFVVIDECIYLNHSYFNGFSNLERIFGNYITL